jgi:uncharacterized membrane protein YedE/YeeE
VRRLLADPRTYVAWLVVLAGALAAADAVDPYVFGLAVFLLGAATAGVFLSGVWLVVLNPNASGGARWTVSAALLFAVTALLWSLARLGSFRWA